MKQQKHLRLISFLLSFSLLFMNSTAQTKNEITIPFYSLSKISNYELQNELSNSEVWIDFVSKNDQWNVIWNELTNTPQRAFGKGIPIEGFASINSLNIIDAAKKFINMHESLLNVRLSEIKLVRFNHILNRWYVTFQQYYNDLPVYGGLLELRITNDGKVFCFGSSCPKIIDLATRPSLSEKSAIENAISGLNFIEETDSVNYEGLVILPIEEDNILKYRLAFKFQIIIKRPFGNWLCFIDAQNGAMILRLDKIYAQNISGHVNIMYRPLFYNDPLLETNYQHGRVFVSGVDDGVTDEFGNYSISVVNHGDYYFLAPLKGLYADVFRYPEVFSVFSTTASTSSPNNWTWNTSLADEDEINVYYHINSIHDYIKLIDQNFSYIDYPIRTIVQDPTASSYGGAYYGGNPISIHFESETSTHRNAALFADVIYHEYFHFVTDKIYPEELNIPDAPRDIHEGMSDYFACSVTNGSIMADGGYYKTSQALRNCDNMLKLPDDFSPDPYQNGLILAGAFWDLRQSIGASEANRLAHFAKYGYPFSFQDYLVEALIADDDDGDISNGTPHSSEINSAFALHGISIINYHIIATASHQSIFADSNTTATIIAEIRNSNNITVPTAANPIIFSIINGSASGQLVGTNPVNAVNGVATITLQSTTTPGIVTIAASSPGLTSGSTIVNVYNDPTEVGGHINKDTTWPLTGSPYVVTSDLAIDAGVILTIEPGVTIKFNRDRDMNIYGALVANGTPSAPISFTANATNPYPKYWGGIKFYNSGLDDISVLNYCTISYGGQGGYDNFDRPLILNGYANPTITNTTMSNNNRNGIDLETGTYSSDINLNITTLPYIIRGDMAISSGATMSLQPGVLIKLESGSDIIIYGGLKARGTATQHIIFTSVRDDAHSGDSNGDGVTAGTPGDWGGIFFDHSIIDANTILDYCEIYYAGQGGYGNHDCPLELHALANPTITNTYLANNKFNGIDLRTGSYSSDILLNITNQPYMIRGDLVVESSATLTISPAVIIKFGNECDFYIRGALKAQGNNSDHIIFTSLQDDFHGGDTNANGTSVGSKGNWGGIRLYDSIIDNTTVMDYCEVMYSGCGGYGNNESPIVLDGRANPRITNSLLLNNSRNAIDLITGDYSSDFKLDILNFPYLIRGDLVIKSPAKLTILPGVILKFSSECDFYIDGSFSAVGTSSMPILFTSIKDDSIGGDSNGDGASVGTPGDWGGIGFRDASDDNLCLLDNVKIFYAGCGGYGNYAAPLAFDNASPKIQRVTIANSRSHGAICYNAASPDFGGGIQASQGQNKFYDFKNKSSKYALYNDGSADIYARNNYWDTNDSLQIEKLIYDKIDHSSKGRVYFYPFNSAADMLSPQVTVISPNGGENWIIGSKQTITWSAIDNDGISKIYFFLSRDAGVTFSKFDSLSSNPGVLNWTVPAPYSNNCKIKIQAFDFSGNMGFDVSNGNFAIVDTSGIINHPPTSPTVLLPINGEEARTDDYLVWAKSTDPDVGDVITYTLELDNNANFSSPEIHQSGISGNIMNNEAVLNQLDDNLAAEMSNAVYLQLRSLQNFTNLKDDSTYYWRVKAVDNYGAESNFTSGTSHFFFNKTNTAPQAVVAGFSPKDGIEVRTNKPEISWHPAKDADLSDHAGTLRYKLQLDDDGEFSSNYKYQYTTAMGLNTFEVADPLSENVRWYYRVQSVDDEGLTSPWSAVQNFWVNAIDEAPRPFALYRPANSSTVTADSITFAWASTNDVDPNDKFSFTLEYSTSSSFAENVVSVPNLTDSSIAIDLKGMAKTAYYWRVKAVDSDGLVTWGSNSGSAPWQFQFNPTLVIASETNTPKEFSLSQNHPNPFNPETIIEYQLPISCHVAITIYNTLGQEIRTLIHGEQQAGYHQLVWDGRDNSGKQVGSGIYLYQMRAGEFGALKKMVLIQ
jgi:hypothetical protein